MKLTQQGKIYIPVHRRVGYASQAANRAIYLGSLNKQRRIEEKRGSRKIESFSPLDPINLCFSNLLRSGKMFFFLLPRNPLHKYQYTCTRAPYVRKAFVVEYNMRSL